MLAAVVALSSACSAAAEPTGSVSPTEVSPAAPTAASRQAAVTALLDRRAAAVVSDDVSGWTSTQTVDADGPRWGRVSALPVVAWRYTDLLVTPQGEDAARATALLRYRFEGEPSDSAVPVALGFTRLDGSWTLASEQATSPATPVWELGDVEVARDGAALVVGVDVTAADAEALAAAAAGASSDVTAAWSVVPPVVLVLTRTTSQLGQGLGRPASSLDGLAAVTSAAGAAPGVDDADATSRVWVAADGWARLGPVSHAVVLRHELLHVATGSAAATAVPLWLEEGAAEVVGYGGSDVPLATAVRDAVARVRADGATLELPTDDAFAGTRAREAYQLAHVACAVLVEQVGVEGLRRAYDGVAASDGSATAVDAVLRDVTGAGTGALTRRWQERLRALAGR